MWIFSDFVLFLTIVLDSVLKCASNSSVQMISLMIGRFVVFAFPSPASNNHSMLVGILTA